MFQRTKRNKKYANARKKANTKKYFAIHLIAEFWHGKVTEDKRKIKQILIKATKLSKSIPLEVAIHKFSPHGITGVIILAESHIAIHSWPEINYAAIDIFTCGKKSNPYKALEYLKKEFRPKKVKIREINRGSKR